MRPTDRSAAARVLTTVAAALVLGGCATKSDIRDLQSELRALAMRQDSLIAELRRETLSTQDTLRGQSDQLFDFRGEISRQLRDLSLGMARLEALAGENQRGIAGVRDQLANIRRSPSNPNPMPVQGDSVESVDPAVEAGGDPEGVFNAAVSQFNRGSLATARTAFRSFLQAYPSHGLAPDAHFYLADILVQDDRIDDALEAFQEIPELFPTASKVPDALYRVALLQLEMEDEDEAEATLERIVNTYPGTGVAMLAGEKLREIR